MHNCSKLFTEKFSNPKISKTPRKLVASGPGAVQWLICPINQANVREYKALAIA